MVSQSTQQGRKGIITISARGGAGREARRLGICGRLDTDIGEDGEEEGPSRFTMQGTNGVSSARSEGEVLEYTGEKTRFNFSAG